jgi:hypothetical protein
MALTLIGTFSPTGFTEFATPRVQSAPYTTFSGTTAQDTVGMAGAIALPAGTGTPATALITNIGPEPAWVLIATAAKATTATQATVGAQTVVVADATSIAVGHIVVAVGIPAGTFVTSINSTTIGISQPTTAALSTTTINFVVAVTPTTGIIVNPSPANPLALAYVSSGFLSVLCTNSGSRSILNVAVGA